ncbi:MAG: DMT family transporter [Aquincola sp.]|nr:DMT family transporter [Aquincola sp.]
MRVADLIALLTLAALWGASFLFMRLGAGEFGAVPLTALRVGGAALFLLPLVALRGQGAVLRQHWRQIVTVGVLNSTIPYLMFAIAALAINAGLSSILNATAPLWGVLIGWLWLNDRLSPSRLLGVFVGFVGVVMLAWDKASFKPGDHGVSAAAAIGACLLATLCYGLAANYTRRSLTGVPPLAAAAGSQGAAALMLALPAAWQWPRTTPSAAAWASLGALSVACTGIALVLYFRLIASLGASRAITVTFLIPLFGLLWGALFLGESITAAMVAGCAVILIGTGLVTGVLKLPARAAT